jgi:hypothetical protein
MSFRLVVPDNAPEIVVARFCSSAHSVFLLRWYGRHAAAFVRQGVDDSDELASEKDQISDAASGVARALPSVRLWLTNVESGNIIAWSRVRCNNHPNRYCIFSIRK